MRLAYMKPWCNQKIKPTIWVVQNGFKCFKVVQRSMNIWKSLGNHMISNRTYKNHCKNWCAQI